MPQLYKGNPSLRVTSEDSSQQQRSINPGARQRVLLEFIQHMYMHMPRRRRLPRNRTHYDHKLLGPLHRLLWQRLALALSRSLFPLFLFFCFFVLFVGLCVVSELCAHLFVSLNYVLFIMACWLVTHKNNYDHKYGGGGGACFFFQTSRIADSWVHVIQHGADAFVHDCEP